MKTHHSAAVVFTINVLSIASFYEQILGMRLHRAEQDHVVLEIDGFRLTVHKIPDVYAEGIRISVPPKIREDSAIKLSLPVANIASTRQTASQLGGCVTRRTGNGNMTEPCFAMDGIQMGMCFSCLSGVIVNMVR